MSERVTPPKGNVIAFIRSGGRINAELIARLQEFYPECEIVIKELDELHNGAKIDYIAMDEVTRMDFDNFEAAFLAGLSQGKVEILRNYLGFKAEAAKMPSLPKPAEPMKFMPRERHHPTSPRQRGGR